MGSEKKGENFLLFERIATIATEKTSCHFYALLRLANSVEFLSVLKCG